MTTPHPTTTLPRTGPGKRALIAAGSGVAAIAVLVAAGGLASRAATARRNAAWAQAAAIPTVALARMETGPQTAITLPGTVQPFRKAQIYARVNGYLKAWTADIGSDVRAGQTLALVDTPDLDQQRAQARGDLAMAQANARLADLTASRWHALQASGAVSQQVIDEKLGDAQAKRAVVQAAQARLRGIEALVAYKRIASPFDGIVTARKTDIGALINAGASGQELFEVADLSRLRIYVQVPQTLAATLKVGDSAQITLPEQPGTTHPATIAAISHALDAATRTMLIQLQAPNPGGRIGAGAYCQVLFAAAASGSAPRLPATAIIATNTGAEVAVLGPGNVVAIRPVRLGHDDGHAVEVVAGLAPGERVIDSPPETLRNGDHVRLGNGA